ncbi:MAG: ferrous iron transport protein B [Chitinispirillales bacterium]|jgi:ferrous iron transport protein B|nr:ferrous iron transport protein B [Chitinispirillales bacterium]
MIIALAGNPNCGKSTLFNRLTGANRRVGNFPGVTVDGMIGNVIGHKGVSIVDLPGIYSLTSYTSDEIVSRDFLLKQKPDAIINITDATNIERNLYLTLQLIKLQIPMILALNMMDEVLANSGSVDILQLQNALGITVVPISAKKKEGLAELTEIAIHAAAHKTLPLRIDFCTDAAHRAIHAISHIVEDHAQRHGIPARFAATKLVEGDDNMLKTLSLSANQADMIEHAVVEMETELGTDREAAIVDMRYRFIEDVCKRCVVKAEESREYRRSVRLDSVLTHKIWALPSFLGIMFTVFLLTFGVIGVPLSGVLESGIDMLARAVDGALEASGVNPALQSLVIDGIFAGVGAVVGFVPIIVTLFFFLSMLEDSGYMARIAFVMDKLLRKIGLSGRSIVPMLMGFGCTVPAIMAARTLASRRDKKMTVLLTPFMSCGAKLPIYALFTAAFFAKHQALVMMSLYVTGIILAILSGLVMNKTIFRGAPVPFVLELPNYRLPAAKTVLFLMWDKTKDFVLRAFTYIFAAAVVIWFLQYFDIRLNPVADSGDSILAHIGRLMTPVFAPIGFSDWRVPTALVTGFSAKEVVISTLAVLTEAGTESLGDALHGLFTPLTAFSFLIFTLLYTPCVAAVATVKRELGSLKGTFFVILYQTGIAWMAAFFVYWAGRTVFGLDG